MHTSSTSSSSEAGFGLVDALGALLVFSLLIPMLVALWDMGATATKKRQAAAHLSKVNQAVAAYVRKHHERLVSQATAGSGPEFGVDDLIRETLLPEGFSDRNVWLQEYRIYIRAPRQGELQAVTLTIGGRGHDAKNPEFGTAVIPSTAALLEGAGGFVPTGTIPGQTAGTLHGAANSWLISLGSLGIPSPGAGHLGALASFDSSSLAQDFLYRVSVPGHPELNAMQTELDMTDHAIRNVQEVHFTPRELTSETCLAELDAETEGRVFLDQKHGLYICRNGAMEIVADSGNSILLREASLTKDGDLIDKPICAPGSGTVPNIFVAPSIVSAGYESPPMVAVQAWATSHSDTQWQIHLRLLTTDKNLGWINPGENYGRATVMTTCVKDVVTP